jgi:parallel beta-helix repeat protein
MKIGLYSCVVWLVLGFSLSVVAQPVVLGKGAGLFQVGDLLAEDDFKDLEKWVVQLEERKGAASVQAKDGTLDCIVPDRGCTVWFREKLKTRVAMTYEVICPGAKDSDKGMQASDLNCFWMANDPEGQLFDRKKFSGKFSDYDGMIGYYASTGGGRNTTTRMRRYPRELDGKPVEHLALTARDGKPGFLIKPDRVMKVQLVAYDDVIQYIVNGELVYEVSGGDKIQIEVRDEGKKVLKDSVYDLKRFPVYEEGYFGFRMVGTHHIYSNFRVHQLVPGEEAAPVEVSSIAELREAMTKSHQKVVMKPGVYELSDQMDPSAGFRMSGSHNEFDLTGVTIRTPISVLRSMSLRGRGDRVNYLIEGDHVILRGGTFENTYPDGRTEVTDFGSYNQDPENGPARAMTEMKVTGDDVSLINCRMIVRGSYPYGYGNMYGIGGGAVVGLRKHSGILMTGDRITMDGCKVKMEAFGHAIFVQGGDQITVRNTEVVGEVRRSNELYEEKKEGDLPVKFGYKIQWPDEMKGIAIPRDHMLNLVEDGIRAYPKTGHMTVENCTVSKCRGGIKLYMARSATVTNCEVIDCVVQGYSLPSKGTITNSKGNAAYGPLLYIHSDSTSSQKIDLEVLPSPHGLGDHPLAAIKGSRHRIRFTSGGEGKELPRPIIVGYPMRFDFLSVDYPGVPKGMERNFAKYAPKSDRASGIKLKNATEHPVVLGKFSEENEITSRGKVRDLGTGNIVQIK